MSSIAMHNASGATVLVSTTTMPDGTQAVTHVLVDANGVAYSGAHPLLTAPAIEVTVPTDRGGTISTASLGQQIMASNPARKGGWITADPNNTGNIYVSLTGTATTTPGPGNQAVLTPGATCPLTINGYVIQGAVSVAGTVAGDAFTAVEFQ